MNATWPNDFVHRYMYNEASKLWRTSQRRWWWFRFLNWLFRSRNPDVLYVQKYSDADWETGEIQGSCVGTWVLDRQGFRAADEPAVDPVSHRRFERLVFCVRGDLVAMTHYYSPFGGFGYVMRVDTRDGKQTMTFTKNWIF
jgi:hypothetical protein